MTKTILASLLLTVAITAQAQFTVTGSETFVIKSGETVSIDGLTLTPSSDFTISSTTITKVEAHTLTPVVSGSYIMRYFTFSNTTSPFTGSVRFSYAGATLNDQNSIAIPAANLRLNTFNGTNWSANTELPDQGNDFLAGALTNTTLKHITLAAANGPLPVTWLSFTATKKENTSVLNWSTATEQNTKDFEVQHSAGSGDWKSLGTVKAAGNATS